MFSLLAGFAHDMYSYLKMALMLSEQDAKILRLTVLASLLSMISERHGCDKSEFTPILICNSAQFCFNNIFNSTSFVAI